MNMTKLPKEIRAELQSAQPPSSEELEHYSYMKDDFIEAVNRAALRAPGLERQGAIDAVFLLAGKLLQWGERVSGNPQMPLAAAQASTRSAQPSRKEETKKQQILGAVEKSADGALMIASTLQAPAGIEVEINLIDASEQSEIRPFDVKVCDANDNEITEPVHVEETERAPRFPQPSPGIYVFKISWAKGSGWLGLKFNDEKETGDEVKRQ